MTRKCVKMVQVEKGPKPKLPVTMVTMKVVLQGSYGEMVMTSLIYGEGVLLWGGCHGVR